MERMLKEVKKDEKWKKSIAEELNCDRKETRSKILEKFQKILHSSISNSLVEVDQNCENITFHSTANTFSFFKKLSNIFQCNLVVNELSIWTDVNLLKSCEIHLTKNNILCKINNAHRKEQLSIYKSLLLPNKMQLIPKEEQITDEDVKVLNNMIENKEEKRNNQPTPRTSSDLDSLIQICEEMQTKLLEEKVPVKSAPEKNRKRKHEKEKRHEEVCAKIFKKNINSISFKKETDVDLLISHLEEHLSHEIKTDLEKMVENIPKIKKTFDTIYNFVQVLEKTMRQIPKYKNEKTHEWKVCCKGCPIHCVPNWHFTYPTDRPTHDYHDKQN